MAEIIFSKYKLDKTKKSHINSSSKILFKIL